MTKQNHDHAKRLAAALKAKGISSDPPEEAADPFSAAREAFYICQGFRNGKEWLELTEALTDPAFPRQGSYRKLSEYCLRALRRHGVPDELREAVTFAWGYFCGLADALVEPKRGSLRRQIAPTSPTERTGFTEDSAASRCDPSQ